jgi:hypothetical protein
VKSGIDGISFGLHQSSAINLEKGVIQGKSVPVFGLTKMEKNYRRANTCHMIARGYECVPVEGEERNLNLLSEEGKLMGTFDYLILQ